MDSNFALVVVIVIVALGFDFINGFHDAANSIATIVATRVLSPFQAVLWAAFFNFAAVFIIGTGVAKTVGSGMVNLNIVTPRVILAGLIGAIAWDLLTWWWGLPTSSSHALMGGYAGAAMIKVAMTLGPSHVMEAIIVSGWTKTVAFIFIAPFIGMFVAYLLMVGVYWAFRHASPKHMDVWFRRLQLVSSALLSFSHGGNDAQKTAGIITGVLVSGKILDEFAVPAWVLWAAYISIALGTMSGGWRIVHTMGGRLTRLKPRSGFCAETAAAFAILFATEALRLPVSTTHVTAGAIAGVGSVQRLKAVRWGVAGSILQAWVMTIPASALAGAAAMAVIITFFGA
jgi:PiT family inorganic phosphate transporter